MENGHIDVGRRGLTVEESANYSGIGRTKFYELIRLGDGPPVRAVGRRRIILRDDLDRWLSELTAA